MKNICVIIACHTDNLKKYFTALNNINELKNFTSNIVIVNSIESKYSKNLKDDLSDFDFIKHYVEIKNDKYLDFGKWNHVLKNYEKFDYKIYDYILFTNDSILIIEKLDNFFHYINNLPDNINIYGYNDSSQLGIYHYQSYLFLVKTKIMNKFMNSYESKKHLVHNQDSLVRHMELNIIQIDKDHDCFLKIAKEWNSNKNIFWENDELYEHMLNNNIFHLFKLKKLKDYINNYKYDNEKIINNFDSGLYKQTYDDLKHLCDEELFSHFNGYGLKEGRNCSSNQFDIFPKVYCDRLKKIKLENLFNIPSNFDIYYYKVFNKEKSNLTNNEILDYYDEYGRENENIILKNNFNNLKLFNSIFEYYSKLYFNININLDDNFTYKRLIKFNKNLEKSGIIKNIINYFYRKDLIPNINLGVYNMEIEWIKRLYSEFKNSSNEDVYIFINENSEKFEHINDKYLNYYKEVNNIYYYDTEYLKHRYKYVDSLNKNNIFYTFDSKIYKILNKRIPGILKLTSEEAKDHYFITGYKQNLPYKIPDDFNILYYKFLYYEEFKTLTLEQLKEHYLYFGNFEKRKYTMPFYFDLNVFKNIFKKVNLSDEDALYDYMKNYHDKKKTKDAFISYYKFHKNELNNIIPSDFNPALYRLINEDLKNMNEIDLKIHLIEYGLEEGRMYKLPNKFSVELYRKFNSDLSDLNDNELILHYIEFGINENRQCFIPDDFRVKNYKRLNKDLIDLNQEDLLKHFIDIGIPENRPYKLPIDFRPLIYQKLYKDLIKLNEEELMLHYVKQGRDEGRIYRLNSKFNPDNYRKFYKDLVNLNDEDALYHYVNIGRKEGRVYELPEDFDLKNYRNLHFDLTFMDDNEVLEHFIYFGIAEKRQYKGFNKFYKKEIEETNVIEKKENKEIYTNLPEDFNITGYKLFNPDLFYYDNDDFLIKHYLDKGIKEKRLYKIPDDFDVNIYRKLNPDVENFNNDKVVEHFKTRGVSENRSYKFPEKFDFKFYKKVYLNNDNKYNKEKIKEHYLEKGVKKKHWIKLPDDFDITIYKKLNQDLEALDDDEIIKQYVKVGYKTRIYK